MLRWKPSRAVAPVRSGAQIGDRWCGVWPVYTVATQSLDAVLAAVVGWCAVVHVHVPRVDGENVGSGSGCRDV